MKGHCKPPKQGSGQKKEIKKFGHRLIHYWLPGVVRRRPQRVTSAGPDATRNGRRRCYYGRAPPLLRLLLALLYSKCGD